MGTKKESVIRTVPLFMSYLARMVNNDGMIDKLTKKFSLSDNEQIKLIQLLSDMHKPTSKQ